MKETRKVVIDGTGQHNKPIVLWREGKVVELDPFSPEFDEPTDETPASDSEKIGEYQNTPSQPNIRLPIVGPTRFKAATKMQGATLFGTDSPSARKRSRLSFSDLQQRKRRGH